MIPDRQTTGSLIIDYRKHESSFIDTSRLKSESESMSFSSDLSTDEEEECLNNIIDAIDRCNNLKRTASKNRFDLRLWRKLCLEEEEKLKLRKINTFSAEPVMMTLSPSPKEIK
uniref:Uncharacterized protein n=1 Tax=Euplotes harpa TaxID=151035 RepID=A0A7S3JBZ9_9SPIT|mmetsp:Transcript_29355/g.33643  ORF Transcript_29355/g.33643 Transcript_29355/m.33643 type:complete len:114 (+) Transcript_29355:138-479(+)